MSFGAVTVWVLLIAVPAPDKPVPTFKLSVSSWEPGCHDARAEVLAEAPDATILLDCVRHTVPGPGQDL